ncbi:MAG: DUF4338 domain-containing protein, partial [Firmicutes bacterium]|nr:DUF4338 domain-containing protein [Bacillota bacterium]
MRPQLYLGFGVMTTESRWKPPFWIGNRQFTDEDLELIRWTVGRFGNLSRMQLAQTLCENLPWKAPNGQLRVHGCLELLEQLEAVGMVQLPVKRARKPYRPARLRAEALPEMPLAVRLAEVRPVTVQPVPAEEQALWDATMAHHHGLGFQRAFGAHQRYWIYGQVGGQRVILGAFLFAAAAKDVAVRDAWLGWTRSERSRFRYRVVSNSRMLIRPGVNVPHLASHALSLVLRRLPTDWKARFGYAPVVVETFVVAPWRGTCYRAANFLHVGQTTGRGRQDRQYAQGGTVREVFVYPLVRHWRQALVAPEATEEHETEETLSTRPAEQSATAEEDHEMITAQQQLNERNEALIVQRYEMLAPFLNEKQRRLLAGAEAVAYGAGGPERLAALLHMSDRTIRRGMHEIQNPQEVEPERVRRAGGGRKVATDLDPQLKSDLEQLISPTTRGDPESALRWTCKSTRKLAVELCAMKPGRSISDFVVRNLLHEMGYSLQGNRKTLEGA